LLTTITHFFAKTKVMENAKIKKLKTDVKIIIVILMCKSIKCFVPSQSLIPSRENISTTKIMIWWWKTKYKEKMYHKDICKWEQKNLLNFSVKNMYFGLCMSVYLSCLYIVILVLFFVTLKIFTPWDYFFSPPKTRRRWDGK